MVNFIALFLTLPLDTAAQARFKADFFEVVFLLLGVPVMGVYAIIMLAYLLKVLTTGEAVVPWISELCCWYTWGWYIGIIWGQEPFVGETNQGGTTLYYGFFPFSILWGWYYWEKHGCCNTKNMGIREEVYLFAPAWMDGALIFIIFILKSGLIDSWSSYASSGVRFSGSFECEGLFQTKSEFVLKNKAGNASFVCQWEAGKRHSKETQ